MRLILYSKAGCHLCEGLQEKLEQLQNVEKNLKFDLEIRDITTRDDWFQAYQYEVPVLFVANYAEGKVEERPIPRPSPRATVQQLKQLLQKYL